MNAIPLRILPGEDLRKALEDAVAAHACGAAFVLAGIGSLGTTRIRLAGEGEPRVLNGDVEILTLAGTISANGSHLHMSVADAQGHVSGGHVAFGCRVRTTAEILVALMPEWSFTRELDPATGYAELVVRPNC